MPTPPIPCRPVLTLAAMLAAGWTAPAHADPCTAPLPAKGAAFSGDSLRVGPAGRPDRWIEVQLGDFYAPELHDAGGKEAKRRLV